MNHVSPDASEGARNWDTRALTETDHCPTCGTLLRWAGDKCPMECGRETP